MDQSIPGSKTVVTVIDEQPSFLDGAIDAHTHVWISDIAGSSQGSPVLNQYEFILRDLREYYIRGGRGVIDCQPPGCGRDARMLRSLSMESGVKIVCCTGFHRRKYYPRESDLWNQNEDAWEKLFLREILTNLLETENDLRPVRAGFIKIALEATLQETPQLALQAAASAAVQTGSAIEVHTEKGACAEDLLEYLFQHGVKPHQIILCHMDKRPDIYLHQELAKTGVLLEYDTFFRSHYQPEMHVWPVLFQMIESGFSTSIGLATDMAEASMWSSTGKGPGPAGFITSVQARLTEAGVPINEINGLMGRNIWSRLARPTNIMKEQTL